MLEVPWADNVEVLKECADLKDKAVCVVRVALEAASKVVPEMAHKDKVCVVKAVLAEANTKVDSRVAVKENNKRVVSIQ